MLEEILGYFGYYKKVEGDDKIDTVHPAVKVEINVVKTAHKYGDPYIKCGEPSYSSKSVCFCCDTDNWE